MSYLSKDRSDVNLAVAFLRSNGACVYCNASYDLTFEFEHVDSNDNKNDEKALLACGLCNRQKSTKTLVAFCRGNVARVTAIENRLNASFTIEEISEAIKFIAQTTVNMTFDAKRSLTISDLRFICKPSARTTQLPDGLKIDANRNEIVKLAKHYDISKLDIYVMES